MSGRAWGAVAVLVGLALVFAPRTPARGVEGCAALEAEAGNAAREAALMVEALDSFAELVENGARSEDARAVARLAARFVEVTEAHGSRAARVANLVARVCGS